MNKVNTVVPEEQDEATPQLQVVASRRGSIKIKNPSAPLFMPLSLYKRKARPEFAVLGWDTRAARLAGRK
jgi:hypothetical protein